MLEWLGLIRSFVLYWRPGRQRGLRRLYRPLVRPGDLVFDIGAHLGDRSAAFAALGARVIALEPQRRFLPWLRWFVRDDVRVTVRRQAVGRSSGSAQLAVSRLTPTVSTLADEWRNEVTQGNPGFRSVRWDRTEEVPVTTLDHLIAEFGVPQFCKLDVEGYEAEALAGLSEPIAAVSVEFVQGSLPVALACVQRLEALGSYEYNAIPNEGRVYHFPEWVAPERIREWLSLGAGESSSGDLYARLKSEREVGLGSLVPEAKP